MRRAPLLDGFGGPKSILVGVRQECAERVGIGAEADAAEALDEVLSLAIAALQVVRDDVGVDDVGREDELDVRTEVRDRLRAVPLASSDFASGIKPCAASAVRAATATGDV